MAPSDDSLPTENLDLDPSAAGRIVGSADDELRPGSVFGEYRIERELGRGGMGVVYLATQDSPRRPVALKIMRGWMAGHEAAARRFLREVRVVAALSHENVVRLYAAGRVDGVAFCAMEYVDGRPLSDHFGPAGLGDPRRAAELVAQVGRGLAHAHRRGILHRDIKPANILLHVDERGADRARLLDFGLARPADDDRLTRSGQVLGTPPYMAPEQLEGRQDAIDARTDVYGLGATLFEALAGRVPYSATSVALLRQAQLACDRPPLPGGVPGDLAAICRRMIALDPALRYPSADAVVDDLERFLAGRPVEAVAPGRLYRLRRWVGRHRAASAATLAAAALLAIGAAVAAVQVTAARGAGQESAAALDAAEQRSRQRLEALERLESGRSSVEAAERGLLAANLDLDRHEALLARAAAAIEAGLVLDPELPLGHVLRGRVHHLAGDLDRAEACWREALRLDPSHGPAHLWLGRLLVERSYLAALTVEGIDPVGDDAARLAAAAVASLDRALAAGLDDDLDRAFAGALRAWQAGDDAAVRRIVDPVLAAGDDAPGREVFHWLLAHVAGEDALDRLDRALAIRPGYPMAHFCRGNERRRISRDLGRSSDERRRALAGAIGDFEIAVVLRPSFVEAWQNLAVARTAALRFGEAIEAATRALELDDDLFVSWYHRARAREMAGDLAGAESDLGEALSRRPDDVLSWVWRGTIRNRLLDSPGALDDFDRALAVDPGCVAALHGRGIVLAEAGRLEEAVVDLSAALDIEPDRPATLFARGRVHFVEAGLESVPSARAEACRRSIADLTRALEVAPPGWPEAGQARATLARCREMLR